MKRLHLVWGWIFAGSFSASGFWMQAHFPAAYHGDAGVRMFYRSAHVYILMGAILNSLLGAHLRPAPTVVRRWLQTAGSLFILASPAAYTAAFWLEAAPGAMARPFAAAGLAFAIFGGLLHLAAQQGQPDSLPVSASGAAAAAPVSPVLPVGETARKALPMVLVESLLLAIERGFAKVAQMVRSRTLPEGSSLRRAAGYASIPVVALALAVTAAAAVPRIELARLRSQASDELRARVAEALARTTIATTEAEKRAVELAVLRGQRFAGCGAGTVIDLETNLMWADKDNRNGVDWEGSTYYAAQYDAGDYRDWRLPTVAELESLAKGIYASGTTPAPDAPSVETGMPVGKGVPWSSETRGSEAARVHLTGGAIEWLPKATMSHNRALPVRGIR